MVETLKTTENEAPVTPDSAPPEELLLLLQRLDYSLSDAVAAALDPYRGLYIRRSYVEDLLARQPCVSPLWFSLDAGQTFIEPASTGDKLAWLAHTCGLSTFDLDVLVIALAPEVDPRYERLYAYLQDDVTRRRPTVDLALTLLCSSPSTKIERRKHFTEDGPLVRHGLIHLHPDPNTVLPPLSTHYIEVDGHVLNLLLGQQGLDKRLRPYCTLVGPQPAGRASTIASTLGGAISRVIAQAQRKGKPLTIYLSGPTRLDKQSAAEELAGQVEAPLIVVRLEGLSSDNADFSLLLKVLFKEAILRKAILYLGEIDPWWTERRAWCDLLFEALNEHTCICILSGSQPWALLERASRYAPVTVLNVPLSMPAYEMRLTHWQASLDAAGASLADEELASLADRFQLTPRQIVGAVAYACNQATLREALLGDPPSGLAGKPTAPDLFAAARAQTGHHLSGLAQRVETSYTREDIILPGETREQLDEMYRRVAYRHKVLDNWGFGRKLPLGKGLNVLFAGSSGTGKTMAASIVANDIGLDLYKINLAGVVSKYIGETEKNLDRIFEAAEDANAILFFDEADALFGKRSEVHDSHDRYANIEISYLLQKMEEYAGITILATNLHQNLDEAFLRRLSLVINFPFPDEAGRLGIWEAVWPRETPLAADVDLNWLATQFKLAGGSIKNAALGAAFLAATQGSSITMAHLLQAVRREYQKLGKVLSQAELYGSKEQR